jgi:beta-glucanase (GH16 family)
MPKTIILVLIFCFLSLISVSAETPSPPIVGDWKLVLDEDFNTFEESRWNTKLETPKHTYRRSDCFFLDDNVKVIDGNLVLITQREKLELTDARGNTRKLKYTSGLINSFGKLKFKYGYFEARVKLPYARGLWPAFWMMPDRTLEPISSFKKGMRSTKIIENSVKYVNGKGMEIDIMEYLTEWRNTKFHTAAHWGGYQEDLKSVRYYHNEKFDDGFHKFGLLWQENLLVWYFDGVEISRWENERVADVPMYLILSTNVGGWATWRVEKDHLPEETLVDYVRVWQKKEFTQLK